MKFLKNFAKAIQNNKLLLPILIQTFVIFVLLVVLKREWITNNINPEYFFKLIVTVLGGLIVLLIPKIVVYFRCYTRPYLTFEADSLQVFHLSKEVQTLEFSVGEQSWENLDIQNVVFGGEHGKLLIRGKSITGTNDATVLFATNAEVVCTGDIRTLVDYKHYKDVDTSNAKFRFLFRNCKQLVSPPNLFLVKLASSCYFRMFSGCTSLKVSPELPASNLTGSCYEEMFSHCTALEYVPKLEAKTMKGFCYCAMFEGCTSIKYCPELPALELAKSCYVDMFKGCSSIEDFPQLPAKNLAAFCYAGMFAGCTSLNGIPELPADKLAEGCYDGMFAGCTSLSNVTMLATNIVAKDWLKDWLIGTASHGNFYKSINATWSNEGVVPDGWAITLIDR